MAIYIELIESEQDSIRFLISYHAIAESAHVYVC